MSASTKLVSTMIFMLMTVAAATSQSNHGNPPSSDVDTRTRIRLGSSDDPILDRQSASQARLRDVDRHKHLKVDSDRLLQLSKELEEHLRAHPSPTVDDIRAMQEIERLARRVKDGMRE